MEINKSATPEQDAAAAVTAALSTHENEPVLLLLSGGSWLQVINQIDPALLQGNVTLSMLDERFSTDPMINNWAQVVKLPVMQRTERTTVSCIPTQVTQSDTMETLRLRWDAALHDWRDGNPEGVIIVLIGIGEDGHIAGIFPNQPIFAGTKEWTIAYEVPSTVNQYTKRLTVTPYFLHHEVQEAIVFAIGAKKQLIIDTLASGESADSLSLPAHHLIALPHVRVFTAAWSGRSVIKVG